MDRIKCSNCGSESFNSEYARLFCQTCYDTALNDPHGIFPAVSELYEAYHRGGSDVYANQIMLASALDRLMRAWDKMLE